MTKEEKIQKSWGDWYDDANPNENGWSSNHKLNIPINAFEIDRSRFGFRPKSLQGIEYNNGWIKIESESDLPKEKGSYWVIDKLMETNPNRLFYDPNVLFKFNSDWYDRISHYKPIEVPELPIY